MRLRLALTLALSFLLLSSGPAFADRHIALVIGNSAYKKAFRLASPASDAPAVAEMFRRARFEVVELRRDLGNADMHRVLRDFADRSSTADVAVIYYAGHGVEVNGMNYLVPVDAVLERDTDAWVATVALERALEAVEPAKKLRLVILDACGDSPFARAMKRTAASRTVIRGLAGIEPVKPNTLIAFAAKAGSTADDGQGPHGPFTTALLKHLTTPGIDLRKAFSLIRDDVMHATGNKQEPFVYGSLDGADMALVPAHLPHAPAQAVANPQADYELALRLGSHRAWRIFLQVHPQGFYADLARARLAKITANEAPDAGRDAAAGEDARKLAERETERLRLATLQPAKDPNAATSVTTAIVTGATKPAQVAVLSADPGKVALAPPEISRSLQAELRRVGCQTGSVTDGWTPASRRALEMFNKHAGMTLDASLASLGAVEAVKAKRSRICPLVCAQGYRAEREKCEKIAAARRATKQRRGRRRAEDDDDLLSFD